jgi:hypothetical protein
VPYTVGRVTHAFPLIAAATMGVARALRLEGYDFEPVEVQLGARLWRGTAHRGPEISVRRHLRIPPNSTHLEATPVLPLP